MLLKINFEKISSQIHDVYKQLKYEIRTSVQSKFIELSVAMQDLVELAVEIWRMEQRINKASSSFSENHKKGITSSMEKIKRHLNKYDIEVRDYTGQKYNEGLNLDILSVEQDSTTAEPLIKETVEPAVMCKGQLIKKAKVIVLRNGV